MKTIYTLLLILWVGMSSIYAQEYTISGNIEDAASGEALIGVNVYDLNTGEGTITNTYGFYSITLPSDKASIVYSYVGYQSGKEEFNLSKDTVVNVALLPSSELDEVVITAEAVERIEERSQMSTIDIPISQIKKVPALLGEVDVLKALQLLPGVQSGGEGQSGLYVRGGSPDQNLILLDGVPVYNANHLFGFFSVFNADAIKDVKLIKGGFPAQYGGRLSSVIDISMKEGNNQETHGTASIGLISSKFTIESPIVKDRTSFIVSARRTYIDLVARPIIKKSFSKDGSEGVAGYYFYDLNAKVNHKISESDRIYASFYGGRDAFYFDQKETQSGYSDFQKNNLGWGNITGALRHNHIWGPKLFSNTTLTYSRYKLGVLTKFGSTENNYDEFVSLKYDSGINDLSAKIDFDYLPNTKNTIKLGLQVIDHTFEPGIFELEQTIEKDDYNLKAEIGQDDIKAQEYSAYIQDDIEITDAWKLNGGVHLSAFSVNDKVYTSLQPRISTRLKLPGKMSLKASFASMRQYINLLSYEGIGLPTDLWLPSTNKIKPQDSWQVALGAAKTIGEYEFSLEGYYKSMKNLISYKEGSGVFELGDWQERVTQGNGESYGMEFFVQKKKGRLNGWMGYTLSWSNRQFDELNFGREFPFKYDRRHDFSIVANYDIRDNISLSSAWVFGTGNAVTLGSNKYSNYYGNGVSKTIGYDTPHYNNRNNYRMANYHRLDLGINFRKKKSWGTRTWSIGAYNVYCRANPFFIYQDYSFDPITGNTEPSLRQTSLFPTIPYITYKIDF